MIVALTIIAACSSDSDDGPTTVVDVAATVTEANFSSLLTIDDLNAVASREVSMSPTLRNYKQLAEDVDPEQVVDINSWYGHSYESSDGSYGMTLSLIDFKSDEAATLRYDEMRPEAQQEPLLTGNAPVTLQEMDPPIGEASMGLSASVNGVGPIVIFRKGSKLVQFHTAQPQDAEPLFSIEGLQSLARIIETKLR